MDCGRCGKNVCVSDQDVLTFLEEVKVSDTSSKFAVFEVICSDACAAKIEHENDFIISLTEEESTMTAINWEPAELARDL